jgi:hypothetical protein
MTPAARAAATAAAPMLLAALLLAALPAHAAEARVSLVFPPMPPIAPGTNATVEGNLTYSYDARTDNATSVSLTLEDGPAWLLSSLSDAALSVPANASGNVTSVHVRVMLAVAPGAPALARHALGVRVTASGNPPLDPAVNTATLGVQVAFQGKLAVEALPLGKQRPGEPFNLQLRFTNEGNGPTKVTLDARAAEKGVQVVAPPPFILDVGDAARVVNVSAVAPAGTFPVTVRWTSAHAYDASLAGGAGETTVTFTAQSGDVPGPGLALALAALALTAAARRRRR